MCRHILNSQVSKDVQLLSFHGSWVSLQVYVQSFCCGKWFECSECHDEVEKDHQFTVDRVLRLMCKCCRRVFQRDLTALMESDKFCEQCQNLWCLPGRFCLLDIASVVIFIRVFFSCRNNPWERCFQQEQGAYSLHVQHSHRQCWFRSKLDAPTRRLLDDEVQSPSREVVVFPWTFLTCK